MPFLREEQTWRRDSLVAAVAIDISTYDRLGRYHTDGTATLCGSGEQPLFLFTTSAAAGEPVGVAFLGYGQVKAKMSSTGTANSYVKSGANGLLVTETNSGEATADTVAISHTSWVDGQSVELTFTGKPEIA